MAPPNGVPTSTETNTYLPTSNNTEANETSNTNNVSESTPVACENCKQNQKEDMAVNGEPPNNNVQKVQNKEEIKKSNGDANKNETRVQQMELEQEAELVSL